MAEVKRCPACGEPVEPGWKICPACEASLISLLCPQCRRPVKGNWKRCPECEARLLCPSCGRRLEKEGCDPCRRGKAPLGPGGDTEFVVEPVTGMEFVFVPGGRYPMGDSSGEGIDNERPVHQVELSPFLMGRTPVTQGQWRRVMQDNPSGFQGEQHPVENVTLRRVQEFMKRLEETGEGRGRFNLPTEAQWEYAARSGGKEQRYAGGDSVDEVAWYSENSEGRTHSVGRRRPNALGLFDMSGNVWEWCRDKYRMDAYRLHRQTDPVVEGSGTERVIRGGSWNLDAWSARCTRRFSFREDDCGPGLGFRLVWIRPSDRGPLND